MMKKVNLKKKNHNQCICLNSYAKGLEILRIKKNCKQNMQWCFAKIIWKKNYCKITATKLFYKQAVK